MYNWPLFFTKIERKLVTFHFHLSASSKSIFHIWVLLDTSKLSMMMSEKKRAWQRTLSLTHALLEHKRQWNAMSTWTLCMYYTTYFSFRTKNKVGETKNIITVQGAKEWLKIHFQYNCHINSDKIFHKFRFYIFTRDFTH